MKLRIEIDMDNSAFGEDGWEAGAEVARILREYGGNLTGSTNEFDQALVDFNGNTVGHAELEE